MKTWNNKKELSPSELRMHVRVLHTKGLTNLEIADECDVGLSIVNEIVGEMGYKPNKKQAKEKHIWAN